MNVEAIADELGGWRFGPGWVCHCPAKDEHLPGEGPSLRVRERDGRIFVRCDSTHLDSPSKVIAAVEKRWPGLVVVPATGEGDLLNCDDDPLRSLDDDFRAELLSRCGETDERLRKIGLALYCTLLRADTQTLVEELCDYHPVSFGDATTIANEFITARDAEPPETPPEDLPTYPPIPPFSGWVGLELLTEEERRDVIQVYRDEGNSDEEISQLRVIIDASAYRISTIAKLAKMPKLEREPILKPTAKRLGLKVSTLNEEIAKTGKSGKAASNAQAASGQPAGGEAVESRASLAPPPPAPWSEAVKPRAVLDETRSFLRRFIVVDEDSLTAIILWIAFSHALEIAETSPRLAILSPTKRCGKSRLLELLGALCPSALSASNISPSAVFRTIDSEECVLLIDEADSFIHGNEDLRGLLNSGHTRASAFVIRSVPDGDDWTPKRFSTWAPVAIAAIGKIPETWLDRSIVISMKRKRPAQKVERLTRRHVEAREQASALASKFARMAADNLDTLRQAIPASPEALNDRATDNWEILLSIADLAGGDWPGAARTAAKALSGVDGDDDSLSIRLLADIRDLLAERGEDEGQAIGSSELAEKLCGIELSSWSTLTRGKPLTPARLARMLKGFDVHPRKTHSRNEYLNSDFADAITLYAPYPPHESSIVPQTTGSVSQNAISEVPLNRIGGTLKNAESPTESGTCGTMELSNGGIPENYENLASEDGSDRVEEAFEPDPEDF